MEIFTEESYGLNEENAHFFYGWYEVILKDFKIFESILEKYEDSSDKDKLLLNLSYIRTCLTNDIKEDVELILKSTPNYFLFSFYDSLSEIPSYVLISKDYKKFIIASEEMECFDDENFDEDERYGTYDYDYFFLEDDKVKYYQIYTKEYTKDYNRKFINYRLYCEIDESERYYNSLFEGNRIVKKLVPNKN